MLCLKDKVHMRGEGQILVSRPNNGQKFGLTAIQSN